VSPVGTLGMTYDIAFLDFRFFGAYIWTRGQDALLVCSGKITSF
jgi:hypothetical protein